MRKKRNQILNKAKEIKDKQDGKLQNKICYNRTNTIT